jgi:hypothetical protein
VLPAEHSGKESTVFVAVVSTSTSIVLTFVLRRFSSDLESKNEKQPIALLPIARLQGPPIRSVTY